MGKQKRTIWDDIVEVGREIAEGLDELINPEKRKKPAPVPIPVRRNQRPTHRDPNNEHYR